MTQACIEPGDKISFIRWKIEPGSLAHYLIDSSRFTEPTERQDYNTYKTLFLETFDDYGKTYVVQCINAVCERFA